MEDWFQSALQHLRLAADAEMTPGEMAQLLHEALEISEAPRYATEKSRFTFSFSGASEEDLAEIRRHLSPFENSIVELKIKN